MRCRPRTAYSRSNQSPRIPPRSTEPSLPPSDPFPIQRAMAARSLALPLLLLSLAAVACTSAARLGGRGEMVGGWSPIPDVGDEHIQELGGWALGKAKEARLAGDGLRFRRVVRGEQQVVSGMNYRLVVDAADPKGRSAPYVAVVYEQVWTSTRELTSFKPASRAH